MKKVLLIFVPILIILIVGYSIKDNNKKTEVKIHDSTTIEKIDSSLINRILENDKIILVKNASIKDLKQAISQFCELYNENGYKIKPRLYILSNQFIITFPQNIDFEHFCYFINYLEYPHNIDYKPEIKAWCSTRESDEWMTEEIANKKVMLYVPEWDDEHDNVYLTTQDNINYKMGFAIGESHIKMDDLVTKYENNLIEISKIKECEIIDF